MFRTARLVGKLAPRGPVSLMSDLASGAGAAALGLPWWLPPVAGEIGKWVGDFSTARQLGLLDQMIRQRSPLAQQTMTQAAPRLPYFSPALLARPDDNPPGP